jgi:hypothetical protein
MIRIKVDKMKLRRLYFLLILLLTLLKVLMNEKINFVYFFVIYVNRFYLFPV